MHQPLFQIETRDGADEELLAHADGKGVIGELFFQQRRGAGKVVTQGLDKGDDAARRIDHMADVALDQGGANDVEAGGGRLEVLALEDAEAAPFRHLQEGDHGVVFQLALAVMQPAVGKIEFARR